MSETVVKAQEHENFNTFTIISFIVPMVGLVLGIVYLTKDSKLDKKLGEHMVAFSVLASILWSFLYFILVTDFLSLLTAW